jgi:uncharacterized membrane protein YeiH
VTALVTVPLHRAGAIQWGERYNLITLSDAAGMALFTITSTDVAFRAGASMISAAIVGVIGGIGGGIIRDVLADEIPEVLRNGELYATAAFAGALLYAGLLEANVDPVAVLWIPIAVIFGIRIVSIARGWGVPIVGLGPDEPGGPPDPGR